MYVIPSKRRTRATSILFATIGHVCYELGMDGIGYTLVDSKNIENVKRVGGEAFAVAFKCRREVFKDTYKKYLKGIK
jgi:hypothetical protein